ncbi:MAG: ABC transporter permease [Micropruina sp.]|uniref:ABC transporter permease n=1 Tax=Micropruina sp. TaxID=2737536 RepID=UPI0039E37B21
MSVQTRPLPARASDVPPTIAVTPARRPGRRSLPDGVGTWAQGAAGVLTLAVVWEVSVRTGLLTSSAVPSLSSTLADLFALLLVPGFWVTLGYTLTSAALGLLLALAVAVPFGLALAESAWLRRILGVTVDAVRPIPPIVLLPIAILTLGGGLDLKLVLILQGALWPLLIQTVYGIRTIDPVLLDVARSFRLTIWRRLLQVRLPAAAPIVFSGLRLAASIAFGVSIMTELVGGERGLGSILSIAQSGNNIERVYAITIVTGLVGLLISWAFGRLQHRLVPWQRVGR